MSYDGFWIRLTDIIRASVVGRVVLRLFCAIGGAFKNSWLYHYFTYENMESSANGSKIPAFFRKLIFKSKFSEMVSQSDIVRLLCYLPDYLMSSRISVISFYLLPCAILMFIRYFGNVGYMTASALVIVAGIVIVGFKKTVHEVMESSALLSAFCSFFDIRPDGSKKISFAKSAVFALSAGVIAGAASFLLSDTLALIAAAGLFLLPLIIASPLLLITLTLAAGMVLSTMPAAVLAALTFVVVLSRLMCGLEQLPRLRAVYVVTMLYMILNIFYTVFGYGGAGGILSGSIHTIFFLFFFCIVVVLYNFERLKKLVFAVSACTIYTGLLGLYQRVAGLGGTGWTNDKDYVGGLQRISATFMNPNVYGEFIIFSVCIIICAVLIAKGFRQKLFFVCCLALQIVNLGLTYSRGCYIAVLFAVLLIVWCCDKRILSFGLLAIPAIPYVLPQNVITRILSVGSSLKDSSVTYRFSIWKASLRVIENHWFVGAGIGTAAFTAFYQNYMIGGVTAQHSHNFFMQITIELSILAPVLMILIYLFAVKDVCHTVKRRTALADKFIIIPFIAALGAIMIEGLVDYIFYNNVIFMFFWAVLAMLVCGLNIVSSASAGDKQKAEE